MNNSIILKQDPKIEFQFQEEGFHLYDDQITGNTGYYTYRDLEFITINKSWFPRVAKVLRIFTWLLNGVPFFPEADSYKKSNLTLKLEKAKVGIWLTDTSMTAKAKKIKEILESRIN